MIPRPIYKKVLKSLEHYKAQDDNDSLPIEWGRSIERSIWTHCRSANHHVTQDDVDELMDYFVETGKLQIHPLGGFMFPKENVASKEEMIKKLKARVRQFSREN